MSWIWYVLIGLGILIVVFLGGTVWQGWKDSNLSD